MPEDDPRAFRPTPASRSGPLWAFVVALLLAAAAWWFWGRTPAPAVAPPVAAVPAEPQAAPPAPVPSGPHNPVDSLQPPDAALPALAASDAYVQEALATLLGGTAAKLLQTDGFVQRVVATVDNLDRPRAPARLWPVHPSTPRLQVQGQGEAQAIAPGNAQRYGPLLSLAEAVPMASVATLYARLYPLFQQAYVELGYPKGYFNDRLVAVLDHLQQAPEPAGPLRVRLTEVKGELVDPRPWVRYEFADPALQALSSGQKILVRMSLPNERRAKALLAALRQQVATGAVARK